MRIEDDSCRLAHIRATSAPDDAALDAGAPAEASVSWHCAHLERRAEALREAKKSRAAADVAAAQSHLQDAVDAARDAGFGWMQIGDAVGLCRGNAYQRFRRPRRSAP